MRYAEPLVPPTHLAEIPSPYLMVGEYVSDMFEGMCFCASAGRDAFRRWCNERRVERELARLDELPD